MYTVNSCIDLAFRIPDFTLLNSTMVKAVCVLKGSGETTGTIYFEDSGSGSVSVTGEISGLADGLHGFHIHQVRLSLNGSK